MRLAKLRNECMHQSQCEIVGSWAFWWQADTICDQWWSIISYLIQLLMSSVTLAWVKMVKQCQTTKSHAMEKCHVRGLLMGMSHGWFQTNRPRYPNSNVVFSMGIPTNISTASGFTGLPGRCMSRRRPWTMVVGSGWNDLISWIWRHLNPVLSLTIPAWSVGAADLLPQHF